MDENKVKDEELEAVDGGLALEKRPMEGGLASEMVRGSKKTDIPDDYRPLRGGDMSEIVREKLADNLAGTNTVDEIPETPFRCGKYNRVGR